MLALLTTETLCTIAVCVTGHDCLTSFQLVSRHGLFPLVTHFSFPLLYKLYSVNNGWKM